MDQSQEAADVDISASSEAGESSAQPTQITSIDGFFNRKRGRPPKNRFVEVYKSAQHSPQAIFTSFKLEKNDQTNVSGLSTSTDNAEHPLTTLRLGAVANQTVTHTHPLIATDLTPSRTRKRGRVWTVESQRDLPNNEKSKHSTKMESNERRSPAQSMFTTPDLESPLSSSKCLEKISVVRAAGTFYPENASTMETLESTRSRYSPPTNRDNGNLEQPEDLSMRGSQAKESSSVHGEQETQGLKLLLDLYQRQWLLPSFLVAASQPAPLDMRLLLENAVQQKMMLLNAAAAGAVAAAAAAVTASTPVEEPSPGVEAITATPIAVATQMTGRNKRAREQDIPTGYLKFRFNEDCNFERCGYRNHQSHFHCNRRDCHYSFCDKTRFVQHTARHERMDTLMGDDFQQFRANMRCGVSDCCYASHTTTTSSMTPLNSRPDDMLAAPKKSSHFHCRKCDYVCTDSNKVVAHRRLHMRLEYVRSAGFRKIASNESCATPSCSYALRHTHYHCTTCDCSVLSRAQLASHRHRISPSTKQIAESLPAINVEHDLRAYP
ncbi:uncharacterized protein LOC133846123 [Drosophila sulfurigaster albostrigata]|uniref:uncharacterized protein LOC133846123 n=1 Tax=Drosophila sulfurigaster albostrigata TaxID=89887 RepID=UPI002D21B752|nr:uncharacterized protein LOC133846123 [Drosophila sulfurigaster albostrigata]XP_062136871.1 uncharacterized protein LOC133846123 [Drosophila sulfurigaster albostrigata]